jgi:uncharacterized membrane protein
MTDRCGSRGLFISQLSKMFFPAVLAVLSVIVSAQTSSFIPFDPPDAGTKKGQGTTPTSINVNGVVAGWYSDSAYMAHGFVRLGNGQITEFDPPGLVGTFAVSINLRGQIVGHASLVDGSSATTHGFLRSPNGAIFQFDVPGATSTSPSAINDSGQITGQCNDSALGAWHGFLRDVNGAYELFDAPNAGTGFTQGTFPYAINAGGEITGLYVDSSGGVHGFVRDRSGNIASFDGPWAEFLTPEHTPSISAGKLLEFILIVPS